MTAVATKPTIRVQAGSSRMNDGLMNVITGAGTGADRSTANRYGVGYIDQYQVEAAYRTSGICKKIHDIPPKEMTRARRDWQAQPADIEKLEAIEKRFHVWDRLAEALITARLFGGALIILGLPGLSPTRAPANPSLNALRYITVVSRYQVRVGAIDMDLNSPGFGEPLYYEMTSGASTAQIHPSRCIPIIANPLPKGATQSFGTDGFWGDPLLLSIESAAKNVDSSQGNIATLLSEAKVDTITMSRLSDMLATSDGEALLTKRIQLGALFQSMFSVRLMDGGTGTNEADKWETRQLSFAGLPEVMRAFQVFLAGVVDIPYSRLFGESPGGLNATGSSEQTDFNKMIRSKQNVELTPIIDRIDAWLIPSALGSLPSDVYWTYAPLEDSNPKTAAEVEKLDAETMKIYVDGGLVPDTVASAAARNRLIEGGNWPGIEVAFEEADAAGEVSPIEEDEPEPVIPAVGTDPAQLALAANDAAPRPLYVRRNLLNGAEFIAWAKSQGFEKITSADDLHVTVVYSKAPVDWMKMGQAWEGDTKGEITVPPGGARIVEPLGDKGAVVLLFSSDALQWRNKQMLESGASSDFPDYQPHVTITYEGKGVDLSKVEAFRGPLRFGPEIFEEIVDEWRPKLADKLTTDERRTVLDRLWAYLTGGA